MFAIVYIVQKKTSFLILEPNASNSLVIIGIDNL